MEKATQVPHSDILKKGLAILQTVLNEQAIKVTRGEMIDLLNFESVVGLMIQQMDLMQGKTPEELLAMMTAGKKEAV